MVGDDQELGLSLSLSFHEKTNSVASNPTSLHLNLMPSFPSPPPPPSTAMNKKWTNLFPSSDRSSELCGDETRSFLKGIDVNRLPCAAEEEEDAGVSSPNSTISSVSGTRSEMENTGELDIDRACSRGISEEEDAAENSARKKLRLLKDQSAILEESFKENNTLNQKQKQALAKRLGLRPRQVEVWFQNRRARTKLKQTEVDYEFLKRCCQKLTQEIRRLQKEVQELRALKPSPAQLYIQMNPPTTLTMCPSCEGVSATSSAAADQCPPPSTVATGAHPWPFTYNPIPHRPFDALQRSQ